MRRECYCNEIENYTCCICREASKKPFLSPEKEALSGAIVLATEADNYEEWRILTMKKYKIKEYRDNNNE